MASLYFQNDADILLRAIELDSLEADKMKCDFFGYIPPRRNFHKALLEMFPYINPTNYDLYTDGKRYGLMKLRLEEPNRTL